MHLRHQLIVLFFLIATAVASFYFASPTAQHHGIIAQVFEGETAVSDKLAELLAPYAAKPVHFDERVQTADCHVNGPLPDHACSPGAIFPEATVATICVKGYTQTVRNVSASLKKKVYQEYGISYPQKTGTYEADHLIPLELGGNNDIANLFPEAANPTPGFHEKDLVENYLHQEVCANKINLAAAQQQIATDWLAVYNTLSLDQLDQLRRAF